MKAIIRYHCISLELINSETPITSAAGENMEQQKLLFIASGNAKWYSPLRKTVWQLLKKLNTLLLHDPWDLPK